MVVSPKTFLITAGTGKVGSAVSRKILAAGFKVNILTRTPDSDTARQLQEAGATVFQGDFENVDKIRSAIDGCSGVFVNTQPGNDEAKQARNIVEAAVAAGVGVIVCSTAVQAEEYTKFPRLRAGSFWEGYWKGKSDVQAVVKNSGVAHWTILQPASFMSNFVAPAANFYVPELVASHEVVYSGKEDVKWELVAPDDIAKFAVAALIQTDAKFDGKIIPLASELLTVTEMVRIMSDVSGVNITARVRSITETEELIEKSPPVWVQVWQSDWGTGVDFDALRGYGIPLTSFREFLESEVQNLGAAVVSPNLSGIHA